MKKLFIVLVLMLAVVPNVSAEEFVYYCQGDSPECKVPIPLCPEGQECGVVVDVIDTTPAPAYAPEEQKPTPAWHPNIRLGFSGGFMSAPGQSENLGLFLAQPTLEFSTKVGRWVVAMDFGSADDAFLLFPGFSYVWNLTGDQASGLRLGVGYRYAVAFSKGEAQRPLSAHYGRLDLGWDWAWGMSIFVSGYFGGGEWGEAYSTSDFSEGKKMDVEAVCAVEGFSASVVSGLVFQLW